MMKQAAKDAFMTLTERFEGHTSFMYLDVLGLVTCGYGNLIDPNIPAILDWRDKLGAPATKQEVKHEWDVVKSMQDKKELGGGVFRMYTTLRATEESIRALCGQALQNNYDVIKFKFLPDLDSWPANSQLALMSWAWACGSMAFRTWPKFLHCAKMKDWNGCAYECHINDLNNPGVKPRNAANSVLFMHANNPTPDLIVGWT